MALRDAPKTTPGRPQMALGPSEGQPLDRPRATLICKNQYNFNVCLKLYWFLHIKVALGPSVRTAEGSRSCNASSCQQQPGIRRYKK